ncbi:hypothetical protein [Paraburkholderia sp. BCC1886]|uniref:hypothetical protein n=1 Tax=Paraburkholderia sp. BCC1886 TaxID=2562670 RepID=UPI001184508D|nr:hypothetical protein [Paraburkholderia sp. BCC1886]
MAEKESIGGEAWTWIVALILLALHWVTRFGPEVNKWLTVVGGLVAVFVTARSAVLAIKSGDREGSIIPLVVMLLSFAVLATISLHIPYLSVSAG